MFEIRDLSTHVFIDLISHQHFILCQFIYWLIQLLVFNELQYCLVFVDTGNQVVRIVHHQNLNKKILVALIACSSLLAGIFLFLVYIFFRRHQNLTSSTSKNQGTVGMMTILSLNLCLSCYCKLPFYP